MKSTSIVTPTRIILFPALILILIWLGVNKVQAQVLVLEGDMLSPRFFNTDVTATNQLVLDFPITQAGILQDFLTFGDNSPEGASSVGGTFYAFVFRPVGTNFQVMVATSLLTVTNLGTNTFAAPAFPLQVGDVIAHWGNGIPLSIGTGGPATVYTTPNAPPPSLGDTISLPNSDYTLYDDHGRNYAIAVLVETIPNLSIAHSGTGCILSWPNTGANTLLQTTNLNSSLWTTNTSYVLANGTNSLTIAPATGQMFFRLRNP